jgi:uncharacterized XkdX family phage protein
MNYFDYCKQAYDRGWATADQLKVWVAKEKITPEEFKQIAGEDYVA